jgi:hypothetical protein
MCRGDGPADDRETSPCATSFANGEERPRSDIDAREERPGDRSTRHREGIAAGSIHTASQTCPSGSTRLRL